MQEFNRICGNTPLIKINKQLYAKLETYNPTGSVKDRMISYVVDKAVANKEIGTDTVLVEATSGNSGISLAAVAASMGLKCVIFMPSNMSEERKQMMRSYGAEIVEAPPSDFIAAINMRDEYLAANNNSWSPKQFSNPDNIECHRVNTGPEINFSLRLGATKQKWAAFIHGSGTGGTIEGIRQYVRSSSYRAGYVKVLMVVPAEEKHGIQGIGDGKDFLANPNDMDGTLVVSTEEAINRAKQFAKETGLLVGISSGANLVASERYLSENSVDGIVVTMLCDRGERYMSIY
jgi:cysteine synthase A